MTSDASDAQKGCGRDEKTHLSLLDDNPRFGFYCDAREGTSPSNDTDIPAPPRPAPVTAELRPSGSLTLLWEPHRPIRTCLGREGTDYEGQGRKLAQLCCSPEQPVLVHTIQSAAGVPNKHQQTTVPMPKNKRGLGRMAQVTLPGPGPAGAWWPVGRERTSGLPGSEV